MSGDVYDSSRFFKSWQREKSEAQVNRHLTGFLLCKTVGVGAGECENEGGLSVIHMSRGAENDVSRISHSYVSEGGCSRTR